MANYEIRCTVKEGGDGKITHVMTEPPTNGGSPTRVETVILMMKWPEPNHFFVKGAPVEDVHFGEREHLWTKADQDIHDNLRSLPQCAVSLAALVDLF